MATYVLTIDGTPKDFLHGSVSISEVANGRNTMSVSLQSDGGAYRPDLDDEVILTEDGTRIFGGVIESPDEAGLGGDGVADIVTRISVVDFNSYADRRFVSEVIPAGNLKAALTVLVTKYLSAYGVTMSGQVNGPTLVELTYDYVSATEVLNQLAQLTGYVWDIDYNKVLSMVLPATNAAPFAIVNSDGNILGDLRVSPIRSYYANSILLRYSTAASPSYAYFIKTTGANFSADETVVVGSTTYTFKVSPSVDNEVAIGTDQANSFELLRDALNADGLVVSFVYYGTLWTYNGIRSIALVAGASGNNITVGTTAANCEWRSNAASPTVTSLKDGVDESLTGTVSATSAVEVAAHGLWEKVISDPAIVDPVVAQAACDAYLAKSIVDLKKVGYDTLNTGIHPGQVQSITATARGLTPAASYIITDVAISAYDADSMKRTATAAGGTLMPWVWQDDAKKVFGGSGSGTSVSWGGGGGSTTVLSSPFPLGGARERSVGCGTTPTPVLDYLTYEATESFTATVRVDVKAYDVAVEVTPGLYNMTDDVWTWGAGVTSTSFSSQDFVVILAAGKVYRLGVKTNSASGDAYCIGKLVA